ncbi:MAG: RNA pseudouridine synthase [Solobacterium sp.]|nr:RNA pseudouridine synthase [Solobacterium sp.]
MKILYEDNHVLCLVKPPNMPVNSDSSNDPDLLTAARTYIGEKYHKPGNVYIGLVHRLDRPVGGVMVFARTSKAASRLSDAIRKNQMEKEYMAILDGVPKKNQDTLTDYLVKDEKTNTSRVTDAAHGKKCVLSYEVLAVCNRKTLVKIHLETGRSHQIRVQFSSRGLPLVNDQRYHSSPAKGQIALWAYFLSFPHPTLKTPVVIQELPDFTKAPWSLFKEFADEEDKKKNQI